MKTINILMLAGAFTCSSKVLWAKGMEDLKPATPTKPAASSSSAPATTLPSTGTPAEADAAPKTAAPVTPAAGAAATTTTTTAEITPSATSKALADRLSVTAGFGFLSASASEGEWAARGGAEVASYFELKARQTPNFALSTGFRYGTFDVTVANKEQSYRGVVETYNLGVMGRFARANKLSYLAIGEIGMAVVHLRSLEFGTKVDDKLNANGVNASLGGGLDWRLQPKLFAGPRLMVGFGRLQTLQLSGNATFVF